MEIFLKDYPLQCHQFSRGFFCTFVIDMQNEQSHWEWRFDMVRKLAESLDMQAYGVKALYLIGSVKTGEAGPCSDIDLLAHCTDEPAKHNLLQAWCNGWGLCLTALNECRTKYKAKGSLVDLHIITDADIKQKTSYAVMLESVNNSARLLRKQEVE